MASEPYDPYIPGGARGTEPAPQGGPSNPKTAAIQAQIDDTVPTTRLSQRLLDADGVARSES